MRNELDSTSRCYRWSSVASKKLETVRAGMSSDLLGPTESPRCRGNDRHRPLRTTSCAEAEASDGAAAPLPPKLYGGVLDYERPSLGC
jgi:hypothetical protein